jgi:hypothetical protein
MDKDFLLTEQLNRTIDVNFRELADYLVKASHLDEGQPSERFRYSLYEGATGHYIGTWDMSYSYVKKHLFPLYDTKHKIKTNKDMGKELILVDPKDIEKELNKIIPDLQEEAPLSAWNKGMIKDYCFQHMYPSKFADVIYARVKRQLAKDSYKS